jgi:hypothetical protein
VRFPRDFVAPFLARRRQADNVILFHGRSRPL